MANRATVEPTLVALFTGLIIWFVAAFFLGAREPWDQPGYWQVVYPLSIIAATMFGYFYPDRAWRWALALFAGKVIAMWIRNGEVGNLWPLTLVFVGFISIPAMIGAMLASRYSKRK